MRGGLVAALIVCTALAGCGRLRFETLSSVDGGRDAGDATFDASLDASTAPRDAQVDATAPHDAARDAAIIDANVVDAPLLDAGDAAAWLDAATDAMADAADDGGIDPTYPPIAVASLTSAGPHTCLLDDGRVYCWGQNTNGEIGNNGTANQTRPVEITLPSGVPIEQVSAGEGHTCAIERGSGDLYCWGMNNHGQLGLDDRNPRLVPTRVPGLPRLLRVSAGYQFTFAIDENNALWCWGDNAEGQLGQAGTPLSESLTPIRSGNDTDWIQIAAGQARVCGLRSPGTLWCVGRNVYYGLGLGSNVPNQYNTWTQTGVDADWLHISVSQDGACGRRTGGISHCWGTYASGPPTVLMTPTTIDPMPWRSDAAGVFNACGVRQAGTMTCWGRNVEGQLGTGDWTDQTGAPQIGTDTDWALVVMGRFHTCALKLDGRLFCTGENGAGQLGLGDTMRRNVFTLVTLP